MDTPTTYRQNVAIVVLNAEGKILACQRNDRKDAWQLPQGGIDEGESPEAAMYRELTEEIGTAEVDLIGRLDKTLKYEWPPALYQRGHRGQEQYYFLVRLRPSARLDLNTHHTAEFDHFEWWTSTEFAARLDVHHFKAATYLKAIQALKAKFPGVIV